MELNKVNIESLNSAKYNPRKDLKSTDPEYIKLKNSVEHFGYVDPVIVNKRNMTVVGGHQRLKVLKDLGYKDIDVVYVDLNDTDEKALNIALNKISGDWDAEKLEDLLRELSLDTDFDVELTGFDMDEIETLFNGAMDEVEEEEQKKNREQQEKDLDELSKEPNPIDRNPRGIKLGDIWKLGKHKLICGDSYNEKTYIKLVGNEIPDMIFTDPPYNYDRLNEKRSTDSEYIKKLKAQGKDVSLALGNVRLKDISEEGFDKLTLNKLEYLFKKNIGSIYCCCCCNDLFDYIKLADKYKYKFRVHVWCKTTCTPIHNNNYLNNMEYIVFYYNSNRVFNNDLDMYYYSQFNYDNKLDLEEEQYKKLFYSPYTYLSINEVIKDAKEANSEHPTVKPLKIIIPKIAISSRDGGLVVDMFSGSGSTLIACEKLNRRCYTVEYAPEYCNETIARWEALTCEKAVKLDNYLEEADVDERDTETPAGI